MKDIGIVIQGPSTFWNQIHEKYSSFENVVYSSWKEEPKENLSLIKHGVVLLNDKPSFGGYGNINLQCGSTISGIKYLLEHTQTKFVLKIRSDMFFSETEKIIQILREKVIRNNKMQFCFFHRCEGGYLGDYFSFGKIEDQFLYWNYWDSGSRDFAEKQLTNHFIQNQKITIQEVDKLVEYILKDMKENSISCFWLKNRIDVLSYANDKDFKYQ